MKNRAANCLEEMLVDSASPIDSTTVRKARESEEHIECQQPKMFGELAGLITLPAITAQEEVVRPY